MAKKKVTKKAAKRPAKVTKRTAKKTTKAVRRVPAPKAAGTATAARDVGVLLTGIEDWVRYARELIGTLPAGTRIEPPEEKLPPVGPPPPPPPADPGICGPLPPRPREPRIPREATLGDVGRILAAIEHWVRVVRERIGPPTPPRPW